MQLNDTLNEWDNGFMQMTLYFMNKYMEHYFQESLPENASVYYEKIPYLPNYHSVMLQTFVVLRDPEYFI